jgi:Ca2+/H+ antiporter, TMEM165/GDT1 family
MRRGFFLAFCAIAGIVLFSLIVMWLWNAILPDLLNVSRISFWQAAGLLVLSKILFGGFRGGAGYGRHRRWRKTIPENWANMNAEEKEQFKNEWRNRCNWRKENKPQGSAAAE